MKPQDMYYILFTCELEGQKSLIGSESLVECISNYAHSFDQMFLYLKAFKILQLNHLERIKLTHFCHVIAYRNL